MPKLTPEEARIRAALASNVSWANTDDRSARTANAREARWQKYLTKARDIAPDGASDEDIAQRAEYLRKADLQRMALKSAQVRRQGQEALKALQAIQQAPDAAAS